MKYCVSHIDPNAHPLQVDEAASYDLIVNSDNRNADYLRDMIREANPEVKILGSLTVNTEVFDMRGYGTAALYDSITMQNEYPFLRRPNEGDSVLVQLSSVRRMWDFRIPQWQNAFREGVNTIMSCGQYDGVFFDNCQIWGHIIQDANEESELHAALQETLLDVRRDHPDTPLVGNSSVNWQGLNGEMVEGSLTRADAELPPHEGQIQPNMNMLQYIGTDAAEQQLYKEKAAEHGAWFGATEANYHTIIHADLI